MLQIILLYNNFYLKLELNSFYQMFQISSSFKKRKADLQFYQILSYYQPKITHQQDGSIYIKIKSHGSEAKWEQPWNVLLAKLSMQHRQVPQMLRHLGATSALSFRGGFGAVL